MAVAESTKIKALREAKGLLQTFGFNGFSFQHIADLLGIKKPSLYDHFKSKEELGQDLIQDYQNSFNQWIETIEVFEPADKIGAFFELFFKFSDQTQSKLCPLTALIADYNSLPKSIKKKLTKMYESQHAWIQKTIEQGQKKKIFRKDRTSGDLAELVLSIGFGAQQIGRVTENSEVIKTMKIQALKAISLQ